MPELVDVEHQPRDGRERIVFRASDPSLHRVQYSLVSLRTLYVHIQLEQHRSVTAESQNAGRLKVSQLFLKFFEVDVAERLFAKFRR